MADVLQFWGKARPSSDSAAAWHPIAYHMLDVAAVAEALLIARPITLRRAGWLLGLPEDEAQQLLVALIAIHDIGKFAPQFQVLATPENWEFPRALHGTDASMYEKSVHTADGLRLWNKRLRREIGGRIWPGGERCIREIEMAVFGHHGRPVDTSGHGIASCFSDGAVIAATQCAHLVLDCVLTAPIKALPVSSKQLLRASWWVAGFITIADWVGSRDEWFPYTLPNACDVTLTEYWLAAQVRAVSAIAAAGLVPIESSELRSFEELTAKTHPTPTQHWATTVELPESPFVVVIEDATGSGKTEAAQVLVHRLMASGRASGAYWAMPTQATANAMYGRQRNSIAQLFSPTAQRLPSLTLGHGQSALHDGYRSTVVHEVTEVHRAMGGTLAEDGAGLRSEIACAAFLADDRRAALLADIGAGTIDQALLGILPSKFNAVRLFALSEKVLILDEVHAFDAYMSEELSELLRFHAALGGLSILLSATLSEGKRRALEGASRDHHVETSDAPSDPEPSPYPLVTISGAHAQSPTYFAPQSAPWTKRAVPVRFVESAADALQHVLRAAEHGEAVVWIRNTVDSCLAAAAQITAAGREVLVFHARFAQADRQRIEIEVLRRFGKDSTPSDRAGVILVATQVVEQSLDLDFDAMVTDLAPIDLIIQRAGRLWRHYRPDRPASACRELVVLSPLSPLDVSAGWLDAELPNTSYVYSHPGILWRTAHVLRQIAVIDAPDNLRALIRRVYESDELPESLQRGADIAKGNERSNIAIADYSVLSLGQGYVSGLSWADDMRAHTRLGDEPVVVRLARADGGKLVPWCEDNLLAPWHRWALSEVKLSRSRVSRDGDAAGVWDAAITMLRAGWHKFEQEIPVVVLSATDDGSYTGTMVAADGRRKVHLQYTTECGLEYRKPGS